MKCGKYKFQAKVFDEGSKYGIDGGRISKLSIWDEDMRNKTNFFDSCIVNYDRGWDIEPETEHQETYRDIVNALERN